MLSRFRHLPLIRQAEATECGHACLGMIAGWFGHEVDLVSLRLVQATSAHGTSVHTLALLAEKLGLHARALRLEPELLDRVKLPAMLHWDMNHFVVLKSIGRRRAVIHDPARGVLRLSTNELAQHFTGVAVEFTPTEAFAPMRRRQRLPLAALFRGADALSWQVIQVFVLSLLLEALLLIAPWYMQIAIDSVIPSGDSDLLLLLAGGFAVVAAFNLATEAMRATMLVYIQSHLDLSLSSRLFVHLLRLPLPFFMKRNEGDIVSRFYSLEPIRHVLAEGLLLAAIDGVLAAGTLFVMVVISPLLAMVSVCAVSLYALVRVAFYEPLFRRGEDAVRADAACTTQLIENIRSVQAIKLFNAESDREAQFISRAAEAVYGRAAQQRLSGLFSALRNSMILLEQVVFITVAAYLAMHGRLTIGVMYAAFAYKSQFMTAGIHILEKAVDFRLLRLHLDRISDIAMSEPETVYQRPVVDRAPVAGRIALSRVSFRYSEVEPLVLDGLSLDIAPGEFVAVVGPSGCGKTTLMKLMLGLYQPSAGQVLVDGVELAVFGERAYRRQVATVMQDDHLLLGSILQNICFFDANADHGFVAECARLACIHDDIARLPMGYRTPIGSLGGSLSAGERQRVLLARALYRRPRILFIDEGTAHLDVELEKRINDMLLSLQITRIHVAHRPQTIALAGRIIDLGPSGNGAQVGSSPQSDDASRNMRLLAG